MKLIEQATKLTVRKLGYFYIIFPFLFSVFI